MKILVLEDDPIIREEVARDLMKEGHRVTQCRTLAEARTALAKEAFGLLLLDVNLPDGKSFDLCRDAAAETPGLPIFVFTADTDEATAVKSLSIGALDFIRKPFSRRELLLRIKNTRRGREGQLTLGDLTIDLDRREAKVAGRPLALTPTELALLAMLMRRAGDALSREKILGEVDPEGEMGDKTLNSHVSRLRAKLAAAESALEVTSVYGAGYRITARAAAKKSA